MTDDIAEGVRLYRLRKYTDALSLFLSLPSQGEEGTELAYYIGLCYTRLERYEDALLYLEQVVTSGGDSDRTSQCRMTLAVIYSLTGRVRLADYEIRKLIENGYESAQIFCVLGYIAWIQKRIDESIEWYEKALGIDENSPTALNGLGYILAESGRELMRALALCKRAVAANPDSAAYLDSLSWVYYRLGLKNEAKMYARRARDKAPESEDIQEHLKVILEQLADDSGSNPPFASGR
ncbi:MAG: tetratricopeptide repeat protein [Spirochaetaceae bacterium]|nr:tetratricopeptide repeat protein [Spirochaetaceae bacterium]